MRILILDNYDSFTFNLVHLVAQFASDEPLVVRNDELSFDEVMGLAPKMIVISPGPGHPGKRRDFGVCGEVLMGSKVPVLGVCLGMQGIAECFGGRVVAAPEPVHGRISRIRHGGDRLFSGVPDGFDAVRYHSLMVERPLPPELEQIAWTEDGIVMGLRHRSRPLWGVQFHPESIGTAYGKRVVENFCRLAAAEYRGEARALHRSTAGDPRSAPDHMGRRVVFRRLEGFPEPEAVFALVFGDEPNAFWLDSSLPGPAARFSYLGGGNGDDLVRYWSRERRVVRGDHEETISQFEYLDRELSRSRWDRGELPFPFVGGFAGYFGYELKQECGGAPGHTSEDPDATLIFARRLVVFDHQDRQAWLVCLEVGDRAGAEGWMDGVERRLQQIDALIQPDPVVPIELRLEQDRPEYLENIGECLEAIRRGETYEVCLTNRLRGTAEVDPFEYYRVLRRTNPSPYAAFLRFPGTAVACFSPECFLTVDRSGKVESRPMKGTRRRGSTPEEDEALREELRASEKDRAENLMIVDLVRHDLGRVCVTGSVEVAGLFEVETYAQVHQMVSTIRGRLRPGQTAVDGLRAAFPPGSMTGAPKIRTMEILDRLESSARGIYSGAIGFLSMNGAAALNVVIRTVVFRDRQAAGSGARAVSIGSGGAVVALSDPEAEFDELLLKVRPLVGG